MSDIQRYALQTELSEDSLGKWVRYEDHLDEVAWAASEVLDAAREAVAALTAGRERMDYEDGPEVYGAHNAYIDCVDDALAAIDALKEKP